MKWFLPGLAAAFLTAGLTAKPPLPSFTTTPSGLHYVDMRPGHGRPPEPGETCTVLYRGWLYNNNKRGALVDAAQNPRKPFRFTLGQGKVAGWDEGLRTMKVGGKRLLIVPPALGYGDRGDGALVPPGATLLYEMELVGIN